MPSPFTRQPYKAIWTIWTILYCLVRIPIIALYYIPKTSRPHQSWTCRQALGREMLDLWFAYASTVEFRLSLHLDPGSEKEDFVNIRPAARKIYRNIPGAVESSIQPEVIGGTWFPRLYHPSDDKEKRVVLHFHGGAYVLGGTRRSECGFAARILIKSTSAMVFFPQYRLATAPNGRFPAAFQDALTSYAYLLNLGIPPSRIVVSGDSAGGHLVVTLLRYLAQSEHLLPDPFAVLLWSPWLNLAADAKEFDRRPNNKTDYVTSRLVSWAVRAFTPPGIDLSHPYLSPLHHPFFTKTPIWVQVGGKELLYDEVMAFVRNMTAIRHNIIRVHKVPFAPHDILLAGNILGFEEEVSDAADRAQRYLDGIGWTL